jgi:hypothetical protein
MDFRQAALSGVSRLKDNWNQKIDEAFLRVEKTVRSFAERGSPSYFERQYILMLEVSSKRCILGTTVAMTEGCADIDYAGARQRRRL